ncbi:MAG: hypothetical protein ACWGQW_03150 [bacterium]
MSKKSDITDLSEYREGWRVIPEEDLVQAESIMVRSLAHSNNVPDRVERMREILDRAGFCFESKQDLVEFINRKSLVLEIYDTNFVVIRGEFLEDIET